MSRIVADHFLVERVILVTALSSAIGTDGSGKLNLASCRQLK
jgi:hypothetical protein